MNLGYPVFIDAKDDGGGGDNWSYKSCNAPVRSSPTNQHPVFTGRMPFRLPNQQCQRTEGENITFHGFAYPKLTWSGVFQLCLWPLIAPGYLGEGFHASHQPADARALKSKLFRALKGKIIIIKITLSCV